MGKRFTIISKKTQKFADEKNDLWRAMIACVLKGDNIKINYSTNKVVKKTFSSSMSMLYFDNLLLKKSSYLNSSLCISNFPSLFLFHSLSLFLNFFSSCNFRLCLCRYLLLLFSSPSILCNFIPFSTAIIIICLVSFFFEMTIALFLSFLFLSAVTTLVKTIDVSPNFPKPDNSLDTNLEKRHGKR